MTSGMGFGLGGARDADAWGLAWQENADESTGPRS